MNAFNHLLRETMKYLFITLLLTSLRILINYNSAKAPEDTSLLLHKSLNQQLSINNGRYGAYGQSVLILKNHQQFYRGLNEVTNMEINVGIKEKHIFPSYSITKLLTSVLIMQEVEKGRLDPKESILTYLHYLKSQWKSVTINHTSGIPRYFDLAMTKGFFTN